MVSRLIICDWGVEYLPEECFIDAGLVLGSHDIYTWTQCLYTFAKDIVWSKDIPDTPTTPGDVVDTGDIFNLTMYVAIAGISALAIGTLFATKRKKHSQE